MSEVSRLPMMSGKPVDVPSAEQMKTKALATLRQATWEATQYLTFSEVHDYVAAVLREVESDEP